MESIPTFTTDSFILSPWIAFWTLWTLWILSRIICHVLGSPGAYQKGTAVKTTGAAVDDPEAAVGTFIMANRALTHESLSDRFARAYDVLRFKTPMLGLALSFDNGFGPTRAVITLTWIFFGLTVIHALTKVADNHRFLRLFFDYVFYGVALAIGVFNFI